MNYFSTNKGWAIAFILLVVLNISTLTAFWLIKDRNTGNPINPREGVTDFLVKELGFDAVQKQKLVQLREQHQQKVREIRRNNREVKDAFFALLKQPAIDDSSLEKAVRSSVFVDQQIEMLTFRHFQQIRILCNESQKIKFDSVIQKVLRIIAPPPPGSGPQGPPPPKEDGPPPPRDENLELPPPQK